MSLSLRVLAAVCILILAAAGCQKGKGSEAARKAGSSKAQIAGAGSKGGRTHEKTGGAEARASGHEAGVRAGGKSTLTAGDDGTSLDLRQGQVVTVVLDSHRSRGLKWILADPGSTVIVREGNPVYVARTAKHGTSGSGGTETWRFRAGRPGKQTVRLEYRREWQTVPERTFRFSVTVR